MALVRSGLIGPSTSEVEPMERLGRGTLAHEGRLWAERMGFSITDEALLVEIGWSVVTLGDHQPDLAVSLCERLGLRYRVHERRERQQDFTWLKRTVSVLADE